MGLFHFFKGKSKEDKEVKAYVKHYEVINREIKPLENMMVGFAVSAKESKKVTDQIKALEGVVKTYYTLKAICNSLGPDYRLYFSEMWEHMHNDRNPDFSYVERFENELKELKANFKELYAQEVLHERESVNLEERVLKVLQDNPVILQTEVYKHFDKIVQKDIQSIIYFLEKGKRIRREKSGRTYMVYYVK